MDIAHGVAYVVVGTVLGVCGVTFLLTLHDAWKWTAAKWADWRSPAVNGDELEPEQVRQFAVYPESWPDDSAA